MPPPDSAHRSRAIIAALALLVMAIVAYWPSMRGTPVWDDDAHIVRPELRSTAGLIRIWTDIRANQQYYPMTYSAMWIQARLWGDWPVGYHAVNVLLHCLNAALVWRILSRLKVPAAPLAAAIFLLHPVHVESVAWISEIKNVLSTFFYLGAVLAYLRFDETRNRFFYAAALLLFVAALFSKTVTASLPAALLLIFWWKRGRIDLRRDVVALAPFFIIGLTLGLLTAWIEKKYLSYGVELGLSSTEKLLLATRAPWFYLYKLLWPAELIFIYPKWQIDSRLWWQWIFPIATAIVLIAAWAVRHRLGRGPLAALLFFGGTLFPALGLFHVYPFVFSYVADHFQYLASIGMIALIAAAMWWMIDQIGLPGRVVAGLMLGVLAALSWRHAHIFKSAEVLYLDTLARNPTCAMAHNNYGKLLFDRGRILDALQHHELAVKYDPSSPVAQYNLAAAYMRVGRPADVIPHIEAALKIHPGMAPAYVQLGLAMEQLGRRDQAMPHFLRAVEISPNDPAMQGALAGAYLRRSRPGDALPPFQVAAKLARGSGDIQRELGMTLEMLGRSREAIVHYRRAIELNPDDAAALNNLAWILAADPDVSVRNGGEAVRYAMRAAELTRGQNPGVLDTLAAAHAQAGQFQQAVQVAERALWIARSGSAPAEIITATTRHLEYYRAGRPLPALD